jgi:hypothetical protein
VVFALSCSGCEDRFFKEVDVDLQNPEEAFVLEATFQPGDSVMYTFLSRTSSVLAQQTSNLEKDARVELFINEQSAGQFQEVEVSHWSDTMLRPVYALPLDGVVTAAGDRVRLVAETAGAEVLSVADVLPPKPMVLSATYLQNRPAGGLDGSEHSIRVELDDPAGIENRYRFRLTVYSGFVFTDQQGNPTDTLYSSYDISMQPGDEFSDGNFLEYPIASDVTFDGRRITLVFGTNWEPNSSGGEFEYLELTVLGMNMAAFDYDEALDAAYSAEGNPFAEPVVLPSYVSGGRGVLRLLNPAPAMRVSMQ